MLPQDLPDVRSELTGSLPANLPRAAYMEAEGGTYFWWVVTAKSVDHPAQPGQAAAVVTQKRCSWCTAVVGLVRPTFASSKRHNGLCVFSCCMQVLPSAAEPGKLCTLRP
jgi:hypothetical protein